MTESSDPEKSMNESSDPEKSFPVVFFNGATATNHGPISIKQSLSFDAFQSSISNKINLSPDLFTVYYERGPVPNPFPARKIPGILQNPITDGFNFATVFIGGIDYYFLAFLKKDDFGKSFPVVFFDGTALSDAGSISIKPSHKFDAFQSNVGHQIGQSPNQFTIYHERCPVPKQSPSCEIPGKRKNPITDSNSFSSMSLDDDYYFLAVLRQKSRREQSSKKTLIFYACGPQCATAPFHLCSRDPILLTDKYVSPHGPIAPPARSTGSKQSSSIRGRVSTSSSGGVMSAEPVCEVCNNAWIKRRPPPPHRCPRHHPNRK